MAIRWGDDFAREIGERHELGTPKNEGADEKMDGYNNALGRAWHWDVMWNNKKKDYQSAMRTRCIDGVKRKELTWYNPNPNKSWW